MSFLLERRVVFVSAFGAAVVIACTDVGTNEMGIPDGGMDTFDGGEPSKKKPRDASWEAAPGQEVDAGDAGVVAAVACRKIPLDCLDPAAANVIDVPSESTLQAALTNAKAGDIVQVRGKTLGEGWHVPADVTLRGCEGAKISGSISFE